MDALNALDALDALEQGEPTLPEAPTEPAHTPADVLRERGLTNAAKAAGWTEYEYTFPDGEVCRGWKIPCHNRQGVVFAYRWKNAQAEPGDGKKYRWVPKKPAGDRRPYYLLPNTIDSIQKNGGVCYLASGEPDVIAYRAGGINNVLCWFDGESSVPDTLADDLAGFGVTRLIYACDVDHTGHDSARKVRDALINSGIGFWALDLEPLNTQGIEKFDINKLWQTLKFNPVDFLHTIQTAPALALPEPKDTMNEMFRENMPLTGEGSGDGLAFYEEYAEKVKALDSNLNSFNRRNRTKHFKCINPAHPDNNNSARVSYEENDRVGIYICSCGTHSWKQVGEWVGYTWDTFKAENGRKPASRNDSGHSSSHSADLETLPEPEPVNLEGRELTTDDYIDPAMLNFGVPWESIPIERILFSSDDAAKLFKDRIQGIYIAKNAPSPFPFTAFHHLGGLFQVGGPGDMYGFSGMSGFGKTSWMDSLIDAERQQDRNVIIVGPEIPWWKTTDRLAQRWGTTTVTDIQLNDLHYVEERDSRSVRFGKPLEQQRIDDTISIVDWSTQWPGKAFMVDQYGASAMYLLASVYKSIEYIRQHMNIRINRIIVDYIQLLEAPPEWRGRMSYEDILRTLRVLSKATGCSTFVTSQTRKSDSGEVMKGEQKQMGSDAAMGIRDFSFKAFATMTPGFKLVGGKKEVDDYTIFNCTKNSEGKKGPVELETRWERMMYCDHAAGAQRANKKKTGVNGKPADHEVDEDYGNVDF